MASRGLSLQWLLLLWSTGSTRASSAVAACGSRAFRLSSYGSRAQGIGSVAAAHGLVALRHMESSQTRVRTHVPCIVRWILIQLVHKGRPLVYF